MYLGTNEKEDHILNTKTVEGLVMMLFNLNFHTFYSEDITIIEGVLRWGPNWYEDWDKT